MEFFSFLGPQLQKAVASLSPLEIVGVLFNLAAVVLTIRASVLNFPVGVVACVLSFLFFWKIQLYADAILQIFFLVLVLYGWWNWLRPRQDVSELPLGYAPPNRFAIGLLVAGILGGIWGLGLKFIHHIPIFNLELPPASLPFWDAELAAFSILAQFFIARKWVENWPVWVAVDILYVGVYWHKQAYLYSLLYAFFIVLAILGWREWNKKAAQ